MKDVYKGNKKLIEFNLTHNIIYYILKFIKIINKWL